MSRLFALLGALALVSATALADTAGGLPLGGPPSGAPSVVLADESGPVSPWVGIWNLHEPDHGAYVANELRFYADGRLARTAMIDTNAHGGRGARELGVVIFGRKSCRLGERWRAHRSPHRVVVDGVCSDGRPRELTLALPRGVFERPYPAGTLRAERAGRRRARLGASFRQELALCNPDPHGTCHVFEDDRRLIRLGTPPPR